MQAERSNTPWTPRARRSQTQPRSRSRFSVTVAEEDAKPLRRALIDKLNRRIERLVIAPAVGLGTREPVAALHLVLDRDAVDEALHVVMSTASSAQFGRVRHY